MAQDVKISISAQDKTAAAFKTAANNIKGLQTGAMGLAASLGGLGAGLSLAGLASFAKSAIDSIDALNDISDATGASIENISALEDVAARTGTSMDTVTTALVKLNQTLNAAKADSPQAQALEAIGLSAAELKKLDPAEALLKIATALAGFADDGNKARLSQELFGKSLKDVAPLLKDLADKGQLVATVTKEQAEEAERFNIALTTMQKNVQDVTRDLVGPLVEALNTTIEKFKQSREAGEGWFSSLTKNYDDDVERFWKDPSSLFSTKSAAGNTGGATGSWGDPVEKPSVVLPPEPPKPNRGRNGGGGGTKKDPYAEAARYIETLQKQIEKTQELTNVQQLGLDINSGRLGKMTGAQQTELVELAKKLDAIKLETEAEKELTAWLDLKRKAATEAANAVDKSNAEYQALIERLVSNTPTGQFKAQQQDLAALQEAYANGQISEQLYAEAVTARFDLNNEKMKEGKTLTEELGLSFTSAFEDAIVSGEGLSDVFKGLEQDIIRIVTRKLVTEPMGNAMGDIGGVIAGDFGNFLADLLGISFAGGGYTGSGSRSGGIDGKGGFMAMLHPQETVVDHAKGQRLSAGNSVTVVVNQQFAPGTTRATTLQAAADASRQLSAAGRNL